MQPEVLRLNLQIVNIIVPYIGLIMCGIIMFGKRFCTNRNATSTLVTMYALVWLGLIWNDAGSDVFVPSPQTVSARALYLLSMLVLMFEVASSTKKINTLRRLVIELKRQIYDTRR